jgi:hypothetical protein
MSTYYPNAVNVQSIVGIASNVSHSDNPPFSLGDFLSFYPQFEDIIPALIIQQFINIANSSVFEDWWGEMWKTAMCWFIAHFCTVYLQGTTNAGSSSAEILQAASVRGLQTSKSVDSVSISYDYSNLTQDLQGWAGFTTTTYGVQFATFAKLLGKGGIYVW